VLPLGIVEFANFYLALFLDCFRQLRQARTWLLLSAWFILLWLVLFAHYKFYSPFFLGIIQPWAEWLHGQKAIGFTHYPGHFLTLPMFFDWARFLFAVPFEGAVMGGLAVMFYEGYIGRRTLEPASRRKLVFIWWLPELLSSSLEKSPRRIFAFRYLLQPGLIIGIRAVLFFAIALTVIDRVNVLRGLVNSLVLFWQNPFRYIFIAAAISILPIALTITVQNLVLASGGSRPELIYWLLMVGLVAEFVFYYFWMGISARLLLESD
jgi:hypothetical protein